MLPLLYIAGVTSPPVTLALTVMTSSPPSTPNDGYQVVSLSWPKGDHRGDRLTRSITRSGTHVGVERHQTGEIFFMALSLAVILGTGYMFFCTMIKSHKITGTAFPQARAADPSPHLQQQRNPPRIGFWGIRFPFGGHHKEFGHNHSIAFGFFLFLHCYFGPSTTTPYFIFVVIYLLARVKPLDKE